MDGTLHVAYPIVRDWDGLALGVDQSARGADRAVTVAPGGASVRA